MERNMVHELQEHIHGIFEFATKSKNRLIELKSSLSVCDNKLNDLDHWIELKPPSASEGYEFARIMREIRLERRDIKDEILMLEKAIEVFEANIGGKNKIEPVKKAVDKTIMYTESQAYKPRVLKSMFQKVGVHKDGRVRAKEKKVSNK